MRPDDIRYIIYIHIIALDDLMPTRYNIIQYILCYLFSPDHLQNTILPSALLLPLPSGLIQGTRHIITIKNM